jgi:hypothetical protein
MNVFQKHLLITFYVEGIVGNKSVTKIRLLFCGNKRINKQPLDFEINATKEVMQGPQQGTQGGPHGILLLNSCLLEFSFPLGLA